MLEQVVPVDEEPVLALEEQLVRFDELFVHGVYKSEFLN